MFIIMLRAVLIYLIVLVLFRVMGKRQLGQMQPFEFVLTLIIADLATIPMAEVAVPILHGIVPVLTLVIFHFVLTFFSRKSIKFGRFISGRPVVVINPDGIVESSLKELCLSIDDLSESLRSAGFFSFEQINYAIMETTGKISFMPKSCFTAPTAQDLKIKTPINKIPLSLVCNGQLIDENLKKINKNKKFCEEILKKNTKNKKIKDIIILTFDGNNIFLQVKKQKAMCFKHREG